MVTDHVVDVIRLDLDINLYQGKDSKRGHTTQVCNLATNCPFLSTFPLFLPYSFIPPVPSSAVCYNWQIRAQTAS